MNFIQRLEKLETSRRDLRVLSTFTKAVSIARQGNRDEAIALAAEIEEKLSASLEQSKVLTLSLAMLTPLLRQP